jgi:hypothetical protein
MFQEFGALRLIRGDISSATVTRRPAATKISRTLKTLTMCCQPVVSQSRREYRRTLNRSSSTSLECGSRCPAGECLCSGGHQATLVTIATKVEREAGAEEDKTRPAQVGGDEDEERQVRGNEESADKSLEADGKWRASSWRVTARSAATPRWIPPSGSRGAVRLRGVVFRPET